MLWVISCPFRQYCAVRYSPMFDLPVSAKMAWPVDASEAAERRLVSAVARLDKMSAQDWLARLRHQRSTVLHPQSESVRSGPTVKRSPYLYSHPQPRHRIEQLQPLLLELHDDGRIRPIHHPPRHPRRHLRIAHPQMQQLLVPQRLD